MQTLNVVPRLFPDIESGLKTSTIRWREARIVPGYMRYVCNGMPGRSMIVWVTGCTTMPLSDAALFLGRAADWPKDVMLAGMADHYPDIGWSDAIEIIEHLTPAQTRQRPDWMSVSGVKG